MKLNKIHTNIVLACGVLSSLSASAAYNIYTKDGLTLDLGGALTGQYQKRSVKFNDKTLQNVTFYNNGTQVNAKDVDFEETDRRTRMGLETGSSYLFLNATQRIDQNWKATANMSIGYQNDDLYLSAANVSLQRKNWGSVSLGKQWLHTGYINQTGTFYNLTGFGGSSLRADFTYIPNLTVSAFHLFPSKNDVNVKNSYADIQGNGLSASYVYKIAPLHQVRIAAGWTQTKKNPIDNNYSISWGFDKNNAVAASLKYTYGALAISGDIGFGRGRSEKIKENSKSKYFGIRADYNITPRLMVSGGYGEQRITPSHLVNIPNSFNGLATNSNLEKYSVNTSSGWSAYHLFTKNRQRVSYVRASYDLRENVKLYARYTLRENQAYLGSASVAKRKTREVTAGVSVTF